MPNAFGPQRVNFAPDDGLWVAEHPVTELIPLLMDPINWVKTKGEEAFELLPNFVIHIYPRVNGDAAGEGQMLIQGIDKTNLITIQPSASGASAFRAAVLAGLEGTHHEGWPSPKVQQDAQQLGSEDFGKRFFASVCLDEEGDGGKAFVHFQVFKKTEGESDESARFRKARRMAEVHLAAIKDPEFFHKNVRDPLTQVKPEVLRRGANRLEPLPDDGNPIVLESTPSETTIPMIICASGPGDEACEILVARYKAGQISYEAAYFKPYAE